MRQQYDDLEFERRDRSDRPIAVVAMGEAALEGRGGTHFVGRL